MRKRKALSDYLTDILLSLKRIEKAEEKKESQKQFNLNYLFGVVAFVSIVLLSNGSQDNPDFSWIDNNKFALKLWGVSLATIYLCMSIERMTFFKPLWEFTVTKLSASVALSLLVVFCTGKAAGIINGIFGVDAAALPFTLTFTTALIIFSYLVPFIFVLGVVGLGHLLIVMAWCKSRFYDKDKSEYFPPLNSVFFAGLSAVVVYFGYSWSSDNFSQEELPKKAYLLAHKLDFNSKHECGNLKSNIPVIFIGNSQSTVLADLSKSEVPTVEWFFESPIEVPKQFYRVACTVKDYKGN